MVSSVMQEAQMTNRSKYHGRPTTHHIRDLESLYSSRPQFPHCKKEEMSTLSTELGRKLVNACKAASRVLGSERERGLVCVPFPHS